MQNQLIYATNREAQSKAGHIIRRMIVSQKMDMFILSCRLCSYQMRAILMILSCCLRSCQRRWTYYNNAIETTNCLYWSTVMTHWDIETTIVAAIGNYSFSAKTYLAQLAHKGGLTLVICVLCLFFFSFSFFKE